MLQDMLKRYIIPAKIVNRQKGVMELDPYSGSLFNLLVLSTRFIEALTYATANVFGSGKFSWCLYAEAINASSASCPCSTASVYVSP